MNLLTDIGLHGFGKCLRVFLLAVLCLISNGLLHAGVCDVLVAGGGTSGVAAALRGRGLERGDKVVLWSVSSPAWLYAYFGIIRSGGIAVVLNANLSLADAKALMEFADTRYVLYGKSHDIAGHAEDAGKVAEASGLKEERCISIVDEAFTDVPANEPDRNGGNVRDDAFILYTSGTTAFPKAVLLSQFSLINVALYHYTDLILELIPRSIPYTRCLFDL